MRSLKSSRRGNVSAGCVGERQGRRGCPSADRRLPGAVPNRAATVIVHVRWRAIGGNSLVLLRQISFAPTEVGFFYTYFKFVLLTT